MVNHEASGLIRKTLASVWPVLLVALGAPAAVRAQDATLEDAPALERAGIGAFAQIAGAPPPQQVADAFATGSSTFTLGLDVAFGAEPFSTRRLAPHAAAAPPPRTAEVLGLVDVRAVAATMREETPSGPAPDPAKSDGSFGRWMKRHWWVPALIGAALVATAGESLWDDDDVDDED